ncbi:NAD-dependent epimerase/dehydratase [Corchorus capsularis]|uniref:NAD-dependent epimerase/dehydratase n=1 Tax=Corchorus capsularis TaxID=210143 RepID=A0A1R3G4V9_COCAP|nr:NAD-dependent epimerase/dehydratase [Corchorus capsularis]
MEGEKGTVCVTGGTGFIASWLIKRLLEEGYSVHTTVRADPEKIRDISFLTNLPGAAEKLKIFKADLSDPDSFDAAIEGCKGVFHVATPVDFGNNEAEEVVTKRAISGALGILKACLKSKTVERVVYTSSASAVVFSNNEVETMDESFWSDVDFVREKMKHFGNYMISKTLTEKAVLEFAAEHELDLVTLIPSFVVGPFICPKFPGSVRSTLALLLGEQYSHLLNTSMVHVDDVARAHIFLLEYPDAKGRYNCSSDTISLQKMAEILSAKYPEFPIPTADSLADVKGKKLPGLSSNKLLDAGFKFIYGVEDMLDGAIKCCKEKGIKDVKLLLNQFEDELVPFENSD